MLEHLHYDERMDWILGHDRVHNAIVLIDGFDYASSANNDQGRWSSGGGVGTGRFGAGTGNAAVMNASRPLPSTYATIIAGVAFFDSSVGDHEQNFIILRSTGNTVNAVQVGLNVSNKLQARNSAGTVIATGTTTIASSTWYYLEVKAFINGASGTVEVHLNGAVEIASTVGNFGSVNIDGVFLQGKSSGAVGSNSYDDLYLLDTTGSAPNNTFLGDARVTTIWPSADGSHTDWTPSSGTNHFDRVNEHSGVYPDGDTTYVSDATVGHIDTYALDDIDGGATVYGVQVNVFARKDDAATRQIATVLREGGVDYVGSTITLGASYGFSWTLYDKDGAAAAWTATNVNGLEAGVKTIA